MIIMPAADFSLLQGNLKSWALSVHGKPCSINHAEHDAIRYAWLPVRRAEKLQVARKSGYEVINVYNIDVVDTHATGRTLPVYITCTTPTHSSVNSSIV